MNSILSPRQLTILFGALFVFQASVVLLSLTSVHPRTKTLASNFGIPLSQQRSFSEEAFGTGPDSYPLASGGMAETEGPSFPKADDSVGSSAIEPGSLIEGAKPSGSEPLSFTTQAYEVQSRDTIASIFAKIGAPRAGALKADQALKQIKDSSGAIRIGETIEITQAASGEVVSLQRTLVDGRLVLLTGSSALGYQTAITELVVQEEPKTVSGVIRTSLSAAASELGLPFSVVDDFVDLFSNRVEFRRDLQPGDTFSVTFLERHNQRTGELLKPGIIRSASLKTGGKLLVAVRHADEKGIERYYDERGNPLGNYFLRYPLQFSRISSAFSYARFHPILGRTRPHNGVDFAAPIGTPVRAVADGIVQSSGYSGGAGNLIRVSHGERWETAYLHLNSIARGIRPGTRVSRGQVIGTVGQTGLATGPHLHFSLYDHGNYVDPLKTALPNMEAGVKPLPQEYLIAALEALDLEHQRVALGSNRTANAG